MQARDKTAQRDVRCLQTILALTCLVTVNVHIAGRSYLAARLHMAVGRVNLAIFKLILVN